MGFIRVRVTRDMPARNLKAGDEASFPPPMVRILKARGYVADLTAGDKVAAVVAKVVEAVAPAVAVEPAPVEAVAVEPMAAPAADADPVAAVAPVERADDSDERGRGKRRWRR